MLATPDTLTADAAANDSASQTDGSGAFLLAAACGLLAIAAFWAVAGSEFYSKVPPFWDSLGFQIHYIETLNSAERDPLRTAWEVLDAERSGNRIYFVLAAVFEPVLPRTVLGLYFVSYSVWLFATIVFTRATLQVTESRLISAGLLLSLLACGVTGYSYGGMVDQRSDLISAYCVLAVAMSTWLLILRPGPRLNWLLLGVAVLVCVLQRPISIVPLGLVVLTFAAFEYRRWREVLRSLTPGRAAFLAVPLLLALAFLLNSAEAMLSYYLDRNIDVGRLTYVESFKFTVRSVGWAFGWPMIFVMLAASALLVWLRRWQDLLRLSAVTAIGIGPYVLTRSSNDQVLTTGALLVVTIAMLALLKALPQRAALGVTLFAALLVVFNLFVLANDVRTLDPAQRQQLEGIAADLRQRGPVMYVSGTDNVGDSILALEVLGGGSQLRRGLMISQQPQLGLPLHFDAAQLTRALDESLPKLCISPGVIIAPGPSQQNQPPGVEYHVTRTYAGDVGRTIRGLDCLGPEVASFRFGNRDFVIYEVK
jgi:hypothetical protein